MQSAPRRQNNVIVRPHHPPPVLLIRLGDLSEAALERLRPVAFLILQTSPGNFQAWAAVDNPEGDTDTDFARRLRKGAGADPTASGATRVAGTANFKRKYEPAFPIVAIEAMQPGRIVSRADLEKLELVAVPEPVKPMRQTQTGREVAQLPVLRRVCAQSAWRRPFRREQGGFHLVHDGD